MRTHPDLEIDSSFVRRSFSDTFVFYVESPVSQKALVGTVKLGIMFHIFL